ncbi:phosphatidylserine/phosphatidylglycerophosphate/cardiolipin synthase family protein [Candidatus Dependentiae bacterium]
MKLYKKICGIVPWLFFHAVLLSFRGPDMGDFIVYGDEESTISHQELYKKKFIIDNKENRLETFIKLVDNEISQAFFSPNDDTCGILVGLIGKEEKSIKIATFFLTEEKIVDALIKAVERGVSVEMVAGSFVVSGKYNESAKKLQAKGVKIFAYNPPKGRSKWIRGVMHNKFIIFEKNIYKKSLIITGSLNLTYSAHAYNKENISILSDTKMVAKYIKRFSYLKSDCSKVYKRIETLVPLENNEVCVAFFPPGDDIFHILVHLIYEEKKSIKMAAFFLTEYDIIDALAQAIGRGVKVEIVAGSSVVTGKYNKGAQRLYKKGAKIFTYGPKEGWMHNKFIVFGKSLYGKPLAWTGSANFTGSARNYNKENVTIFSDLEIVGKYNKRFDYLKKDWCSVYKYVNKRKKRKKKKTRFSGKFGIKKRKRKSTKNGDGIFKEDKDLQHKNKKRKTVYSNNKEKLAKLYVANSL